MGEDSEDMLKFVYFDKSTHAIIAAIAKRIEFSRDGVRLPGILANS